MTKSLLIIFSFLYSSYASASLLPCKYGEENSCPIGFYCIHFNRGVDVCLKKYEGERRVLDYPFGKLTEATCDQGNLSPEGNSHTWSNTAFALDLWGDRLNKDNYLYASADGVAFNFDECTTSNDQCGLGFGNQVKIFTDDNFIVFYAHLSKVIIKNGDKVRKGDLIGIEGDTGWAGESNRHLHFSLHYDWKAAGMSYWQTTGYLPPSVPFVLSDCHNKLFHSDKMKCNRSSSVPDVLCQRPH